ncbi:NAD(P)/FAD-dependent oxidoreductase [Oceanomicrobium pacificus]|uniref:FAD-dependent oxidoreductase n=1 Tax=Oceanomicrobium pacificus TaxID=2692916 RepID=A0A6B0TR22_9RHOB|nr:FAD-dependent oxidoreductase [Oceanomicrobium pacificus]MXU64198.1 FAD-dependent oxidoreductase [Oceanomicrobium pacificus]
MPKAVIAGAGINGLSTAWALVQTGWTVEICESGPLPNPRAASWDRHRLIRPHYAESPGYAARMPDAFAAWDKLWSDLGTSHYVERGILALSRVPGDWTETSRAAFDASGQTYDLLSASEVAERYPMLDPDGVRFGLMTDRGGVLLSDRIIADLIAWLRVRGVTFHDKRPATGVDPASGRLDTVAGPLQGDLAIVATGVGLPALLPPDLDLPLEPRRTVVVYLDPSDDLAALWADAPCWVDLGGTDDLWGMAPVGDIPMKIGYGLHTGPGDPVKGRTVTPADTEAILAAYRGRFRGIDRFTVRETIANFYLMAPDARFLLHHDRRAVWLSADSGHGFKFGPLTGLDVARAAESGTWDATARRMAGLELPGASV